MTHVPRTLPLPLAALPSARRRISDEIRFPVSDPAAGCHAVHAVWRGREGAEVDTHDGVRVCGDDWQFHLRTTGTEAHLLLTVTAASPTALGWIRDGVVSVASDPFLTPHASGR